jgi:hypothetical protein
VNRRKLITLLGGAVTPRGGVQKKNFTLRRNELIAKGPINTGE